MLERVTRQVARKSEFGQLLLAQRRHARFVADRLGDGWGIYRGLAPTSTSLAALRIDDDAPGRVSILVPSLAPGAVFAGIRTALAAACALAARLGRPLRIVTFGVPMRGTEEDVVDRLLRAELGYSGPRVVFTSVWAREELVAPASEIWIATHWGTAHALDVACKIGVIAPRSVVYLVQDHEPSFYASSSDSALAQATYHAGFQIVVNSAPLAAALRAREGIDVGLERIFRPELDEARLAAVGASAHPTGPLVVNFYARPSKPRNAFSIGVAALKVAAARLEAEGIHVEFRSMGDVHPTVRLTAGQSIAGLGKLSWQGYFDELAKTDVLLSLQMSPHPSHPPLDAVVGGGWAVTNEVDGSRADLSPRLLAVVPDPGALAEAIVVAVRSARTAERSFDGRLLASLGDRLDTVMTRVADDLG
ncbi:hypothetical protein SOM13_09865 [Frigoribacterium sp. CFBP9030]|nr:hypothetical protein [Frigoribacterium sp. CFBP9030]